MKEIDTITVTSSTEGLDIQRIDAELKALILATEGMIPGSRNFGLAGEFLTRPPLEAANLLAIELEEKVSEYIPEITIASVEMRPTKTLGSMSVTIYVERRDGI
ncbi:MAG TPA: hypothetical protein H9713_11620 [Candidatus Mediterraneibacter surreyensis]|nr:hypothetical protein [Candidatus Mediterraneibacter surreyensis]